MQIVAAIITASTTAASAFSVNFACGHMLPISSRLIAGDPRSMIIGRYVVSTIYSGHEDSPVADGAYYETTAAGEYFLRFIVRSKLQPVDGALKTIAGLQSENSSTSEMIHEMGVRSTTKSHVALVPCGTSP